MAYNIANSEYNAVSKAVSEGEVITKPVQSPQRGITGEGLIKEVMYPKISPENAKTLLKLFNEAVRILV